MVLGSTKLQRSTKVGSLKNGSVHAVSGSGIKIMSGTLMPFQLAMLDPSNILPSSNTSSSAVCAGTVTMLLLGSSVGKSEINVFQALVFIHCHNVECGHFISPLAKTSGLV
jgi:hypothetical protein